MKDIVIQQLVAMRQQIDSLGSQVDAALSLMIGPEDGQCQHPPDKRKNLAMGGRVWQCECGYIHTGEEVT